jgi:hypothetical protein
MITPFLKKNKALKSSRKNYFLSGLIVVAALFLFFPDSASADELSYETSGMFDLQDYYLNCDGGADKCIYKVPYSITYGKSPAIVLISCKTIDTSSKFRYTDLENSLTFFQNPLFQNYFFSSSVSNPTILDADGYSSFAVWQIATTSGSYNIQIKTQTALSDNQAFCFIASIAPYSSFVNRWEETYYRSFNDGSNSKTLSISTTSADVIVRLDQLIGNSVVGSISGGVDPYVVYDDGNASAWYALTLDEGSPLAYSSTLSYSYQASGGHGKGFMLAFTKGIYGEILPPDYLPDDLIIIPAQPLCEDQEQIFNLNFPNSFNNYKYYFAFDEFACSAWADFDGYRDLSTYNLGQAFSTSTNKWGSSSLELCSVLVDDEEEPVSASISYYDIYASTSDQCSGFYGYDQDYWCADVCSGLATTTLGGEIACGGRRIACWVFMPHSSSRSYFSQAFEKIKDSFPFSVYFDITEAFHGFSTSTHETVGLYAPAPAIGSDGRATLTPVLIIDQSFTKKLVGGETAFNFYRSTILGVFWILACLYVVKKMRKK